MVFRELDNLRIGLVPSLWTKTLAFAQFCATIGRGVVIKPHVRIKYPWNLRVGNDCWIGEDVWIDNLAEVRIEDDVCLSQGVFLCTGSHDHRQVTFDLIVKPIVIEAEAWVAGAAIVLPGAVIGRGAIVAAGCVVPKDVAPGLIVGGLPAVVIGDRVRTD